MKMIEIAPGVHLRLRGAEETWRAIESDFYMPSQCVVCAWTIFGIQDADFVLCPNCRVVSPMEGSQGYREGDEGGEGGGGVGLGFTLEDLANWQEEIAIQRRRAARMVSPTFDY